MGRQRKSIVKLPKKKLPTIFICPSCGEESIKIPIIRGKTMVEVKCSKCGLVSDISVSSGNQPVDIFCKFVDMVYTGRLVP